MKTSTFVLATTILLGTAPAHAVDATLQLELTGDSVERRAVQYDCAAEQPLQVVYINAAPNFLALVPIVDEPQPIVFASVVSETGTSYVAGKWEWRNQGIDATLHDTTLGADADPVLTCSEFIQTP